VSAWRGSIAQDAFDKLNWVDIKAPIEITILNQFGQEEVIDGGGEFITSLCKEMIDTNRGLWLANKKNELYPNPHSYATEQHSLDWYRFIGRILGKAMYEGISVNVAFASFFLAKWLGKQESFLDDLESLDPELYKGLIFFKHYTGDLHLNFTVNIEDSGIHKTIDLIPDGSNVAVTCENRLQFINLMSQYRVSERIELQSKAFVDGFLEVIDSRWLRLFNQSELQALFKPVDIDLRDLRKHTGYDGQYNDAHSTIIAFWEVLQSFNPDQQRGLLEFVTENGQPPA